MDNSISVYESWSRKINPDSTVVLDDNIALAESFDEAAFARRIVWMWETKGRENGEMFIIGKDFAFRARISYDRYKKLARKWEELGIVTTQMRGCPRLKYFKVNEMRLGQYLEDCRKRAIEMTRAHKSLEISQPVSANASTDELETANLVNGNALTSELKCANIEVENKSKEKSKERECENNTREPEFSEENISEDFSEKAEVLRTCWNAIESTIDQRWIDEATMWQLRQLLRHVEWDDIFEMVEKVKMSEWFGGGNFRPALKWALQPENFQRILGGGYDRRHEAEASSALNRGQNMSEWSSEPGAL